MLEHTNYIWRSYTSYASMFCVVIIIHNLTKKGVIQW